MVWDNFLEKFLSGHELTLVLNFMLCIIAGIVIGADREKKGKSAGVSTYSLVACGAMLFSSMSHMVAGSDPTRIAAQIVTGIGFLGGGIILRKEGTGKVGNVTTAAGIWFTAAIGMTIGYGFYSISVLSVIFAYIIFGHLPHFDSSDHKAKKDE